MARAMKDGFGYESVMVCLVHGSEMRLECRVSRGEIQKFGKLEKKTFSLSAVKSVMRSGKKISRSYYIQSPTGRSGVEENAPEEVSGKDVENCRAFHGSVIVPFQDDRDTMIGVFAVSYPPDKNEPTLRNIETLEVFASIVGLALQRMSIERETRITRNFLANLTEYTKDAIFTVNMDGTIKSWNAGAESLYGYRKEEVIGNNMDDLLDPPEHRGRSKGLSKRLAEEGGSIETKSSRIGKDGRRHLVLTTCFPLTDAEGYVTGLTIIDRDVSCRESLGGELRKTSDSLRHELKIAGRQHLKTLRLLGAVQKENVGLGKLIDKVRRTEAELKVSNKKLEELSTLDDLTKLSNRRHLNRKLSEEMKRSNRFKRPLAFIMMDIDHFKEYNDTFGHIPGDNILKVLAQLLETNVREIDFVARYGGDEFCILLPETDADDAEHQAERIRKLVHKYPFEGQGGISGGRLTVSVGVAIYPEDAQSKVKLVEHADKALYVAKKTGGNCVIRYNHNLERTEIIQA
ncbi:MAG: GGDEF domain-containing protein [Gemmatimonadota bacterium]|nr:MAG: GGDEF domain-containing protein [Gemmatimonadota bacterium]